MKKLKSEQYTEYYIIELIKMDINTIYTLAVLAVMYYHKDYLLKVYEATTSLKMLMILFVMIWWFYGHHLANTFNSVSSVVDKTSYGIGLIWSAFDGVKNAGASVVNMGKNAFNFTIVFHDTWGWFNMSNASWFDMGNITNVTWFDMIRNTTIISNSTWSWFNVSNMSWW